MKFNHFLAGASLWLCAAGFAQPAAGLDESFDTGFATNSTIESIALQKDGKIIVTGHFDSRIVRLHPDGAVDEGFTRPSLWGAILYSTAFTSDEKLIVGGEFTTFLDTKVNRLVRLNTDGKVDETFGIGTGANNTIAEVAVLPDGKILIAGAFTLFNNVSRAGIARLNADGSLDTGFDPGTGITGITGQVNGMHVQTNGKIYLYGYFTTYNGKPANFSVRINPDGSYDDSFTPPRIAGGMGGINTIDVVSTLPDGKILIGGHFGSVNGITRRNIARLNDDGSVDTSFGPPQGPQLTWGSKVITICPLPDGKTLVGGIFATYDNVDRKHLVRINPNGALDAGFDTGTGFTNSIFNANVAALKLQPDGKILVGGHFSHYNGIQRLFMARLNGELISSVENTDEAFATMFPNPATDYLQFRRLTPGSVLGMYDATGKAVLHRTISHPEPTIAVGHLPKGLYFIRLNNEKLQKVILK